MKKKFTITNCIDSTLHFNNIFHFLHDNKDKRWHL